jgi:PhzF family phenazine biosynthesis protein
MARIAQPTGLIQEQNTTMPKIPIYHVDAFTAEVFSGNPAAVCPLHEWLSDSLMQAIAAENNLSETAFFLGRGGDYELRWFTPKQEVDLCGHATLAAAHVLFTHLEPPAEKLTFQSRSGSLSVKRDGQLLAMNFPSYPPEPGEPRTDLIDAIGLEPIEILCGREHLLVYGNQEDVSNLQPDFAALADTGCSVIVTAPGRDCDFVSRYFAPSIGIPEDPVTGSAHCTLIPYWSKRLAKDDLHARQLSARGGELFCRRENDRTRIAGRAVLYLEGMIQI